MQTFLALVLLLVNIVDGQGFKIGQTVKTTSGDISGQPSSWKLEVSEYLGIPFAEPPVGKLRWAAPVATKGFGKAINATEYVRCFRVDIEGFLNTYSNLLTGTVRLTINYIIVIEYSLIPQLMPDNDTVRCNIHVELDGG